MTEIQVQGMSLIAMLVSLPLISWGSTTGVPAATVAGAVLLVAALVALAALRWIDLKEEP